MIGDMNNFFKFVDHNGEIVRVGNNATCHITRIGSITLDGKTNTNDVYFIDGLKHNLLSVGQLVDKVYQLQFIEKTSIIKDKDGKLIGIGTRSRGNVFQLNPIEMTCLVAKVDNSQLWHRLFCHINFENIVKDSNTFVVRDLPRIMKHTNIIYKECVMAKKNKVSFLGERISLPQRNWRMFIQI